MERGLSIRVPRGGQSALKKREGTGKEVYPRKTHGKVLGVLHDIPEYVRPLLVNRG